MLTMLPGRSASRQRRAAACIMCHVPFRLVLMTAFQPLTEKSIAGCGNCPPALLTRRSSRPRAAQTRSNIAPTCSGSRMSATSPDAASPRRFMTSTSASSLARVRPATTTCAPRRASNQAIPRPMPPAPPETSATLPTKAPGAKMVGRSASAASSSPKEASALAPVMAAHVLQQLARVDHLAHFGGAGADLEELDRAVEAVDFRLPDISGAAVDLHRLVEHQMDGVGGVHHRGCRQLVDVAAPAFTGLERRRGGQRAIGERAHRLDLDVHVGQHRLHHLERPDRLAELLAGLRVVEGEFERALADAEADRGDHRAFEIESAHHDRHAAVLHADEIFGRNAAILEHQLRRLTAAIAHLLELLRDPETREMLFD